MTHEPSTVAAASIEVTVDRDSHVGTVRFERGRANYLDLDLTRGIVDSIKSLEGEGARAILLCSRGKHFCAGAEPGALATMDFEQGAPHLYDVAIEIFEQPLPIVAAVQGAAVGGGLGLALAADFRVAAPEARFSANFVQLGLHHGFGLTVTLPDIVGRQRALDLLLNGHRIDGATAHQMGLVDELVPIDDVEARSFARAKLLASGAPLAVRSIRNTMRGDLAARTREALAHERREQERLQKTDDFVEGISAVKDRRTPVFNGR